MESVTYYINMGIIPDCRERRQKYEKDKIDIINKMIGNGDKIRIVRLSMEETKKKKKTTLRPSSLK